MSKREIPVIAVVLTYDSIDTAPALVGQLLDDHHEVVVLDDASTDGTPQEIKDLYGRNVRVMTQKEHVGPVANRNRIIRNIQPSYIRFVNSYMTLMNKGAPDIIRDEMSDPDIGALGGLILNPDGSPVDFYYGPHFSPMSYLGSGIYMGTKGKAFSHPKMVQGIRSLTNPLFKTDEYPDPWEEPGYHETRREVGFVAKGNMVVHSNVFEALNGFDERFRYVEDLEFAQRLSYCGLKRVYRPGLEVKRSIPDSLSAKAGNGEYLLSLLKLMRARRSL
jgi:glycosyltransferase involved in cell wall biosynthesis